MNRSSAIAAVVIVVTLACVGGGLAAYKYLQITGNSQAGGGPPSQSIDVVEARQLEWHPTADLVGTVFSLRSIRVSNELAGTIRSVNFESGATIEPGQLLLAMDDSIDRADLAVAQASVRVAEANVATSDIKLRLATTELKRMEDAAQGNAVNPIELDRMRSDLQQKESDRARMQAEVDQAKARVHQVDARIAKLEVHAPFRARTGIRTIHEGQYLSEGTPVVMLEEVADHIYLDFAIPQEYLPRVKPGVVVLGTSSLFGDKPLRIEVVAVDATVSDDTRNVRVRSIVDNRGDVLRPGMSVQIRVPVEEPKPYVAIPGTAVRRASYADQIYVIVPDEKGTGLVAKQRFVKLGPTVGEDVIVLDGLKLGERVASSGSFKLRDNAAVTVAPHDNGPDGKGAVKEAAARTTH